MSRLRLTKVAAPSTPDANKSEVYVDTVDRRLKQIDDNGVISTLSDRYARNLLINGGMAIQQRVAVASTAIPGISTTTRGGQVADRWAVTSSVASNLNWAQIDSSGSPETGLLSRYYGSIISASAGKKVMLSQFINNTQMAHVRGQKVRLSIKYNQKVGAGQTYKLGLLQLASAGTVDTSPAFLSGAWSVTGSVDPAWGTNLAVITPDASPTGENGTITGNYLNVTTVATTWVRSSCVFTVPTTAKNLVVVFFSDATGGTTDNISLTEVQLTQGPDIVDYASASFAEELVNCQRFFSKSFPQGTVPAQSGGVNGCVCSIIGKAGATALAVHIPIRFPQTMFKSPTIVLFSPSSAAAIPYRIDGATPAVQTSPANIQLTDNGLVVTATGDANGAVGDLVGVHFTADAEFVA